MFKALVVGLIASCSALVIVPLFTDIQIAFFFNLFSKGAVLVLISVVGFSFLTALLQAIRGESNE